MGRVAPHMFYQACKVSGKNSTPCVEKKIEGTVVIEVDFDPAKDMTITCDCVGILKERNVDVEHRFPDQSGARNKKKSTRCRMVFRTTITHSDGSPEVLQTTSQPIVCTQPPGVPEICKKSLAACPCTGGVELFILGKNFLKDTRVVFQQNDIEPVWEETVQPDKEFLQQTHLVCTVPAYQRGDIVEPVTVRLLVTSSGKTSEPHTFTYTPAANPVLQPAVGTSDITQSCLALASSGITPGSVDLNRVFGKPSLGPPAGLILPGAPTKAPPTLLPGLTNQFLPADPSSARLKKDIHPVRVWSSMPHVVDPTKTEDIKAREDEHNKILGLKMMPPPPLLPISARRASSNVLIIPDAEPATTGLKTEILDESSQGSTQLSPEELKGIDLRMKPVATVMPMATVSDLLSTQSPSLATFQRFVSNPSDTPLPTQSGQSVEKYLSHIENPAAVKAAGQSPAVRAAPAVATAAVGTITAAVVAAGAAVSVTASNATGPLPGLALNKLHNGDKALGSQFNDPVIFGPQPPSTNLLTASLPSAPATAQKVPFGNDIAMSSIYASSVMEKDQQKPPLVEQTTIQDTVAARLLAVGLNPIVSTSQTKTEYQETALTALCPNHPSAVLPPVTETPLPNFPPSAISSTTEASTLSVPTLLPSVVETSNMIGSGSPLLFNNSQQSSSKVLLSSPTASQKAEEQLIDNDGKHSNQPPVSLLGGTHNIPLLSSSAASTNSASLNMSVPSSTINGNLLAVTTESESALMTSSNTRLDALVSSAIESRILEANRQTQTAEKLNVFQATGNIMNPVSTENAILNSQSQVTLSNDLNVAQNNSASPVHVSDIGLSSAITSVPPVSSFSLNALAPAQPAVQITQESLILNNNVTAAFSEHILGSPPNTKAPEALVLNPVNESSMAIDTPIASSSGAHMILRSPTRASPIAMKNLILGAAGTATDESLLGTATLQNSRNPKNVISSPPLGGNIHLTNTSTTSPIAVKTMILAASSEVNKSQIMNAAIDVKGILASTAVNGSIALSTAASHCTSPIAMKKFILESVAPDVHTSPAQPAIAVKSVLNTQPSATSLLSAPVPGVALTTEKLEALVESTINNHILAPNPVQPAAVTASMNLETTTCTATNSVPLAAGSLATILGSNMSSGLTSNPALLMQNSALPPVPEQQEMHSSSSISSIESQNTTLVPSQSLQDDTQRVLSSQAQSVAVAESSLMTMFSSESVAPVKSPTLHSGPAVATTCASLLDHHLSRMFVGQQTETAVHSLLPPSQTAPVDHSQTICHPPQFPSANVNSTGLVATGSLASKLGEMNSATAGEGQSQARLINQVLMDLAVGGNEKTQMETTVTPENNVPKAVENTKYLVGTTESKISESSAVEPSSSPAMVKLDVVQASHLHQQQEQQQQVRQEQQQEQRRQPEEHVVPSASLPVPVAEISSGRQANKGAVPASQGPAQKKLEEGMVPQELTQMSESDLLSYINPSCFDQV